MYDTLNIEYHSEHRLLVSRPQALDDLSTAQLLNFILALEEAEIPFKRLLDLIHTAGVFVSNTAILEYAQWRLQNLPHTAPFRTAILVRSPESEAAANLYATLVKGSKAEVAVFRDPSQAAEWLTVPESAISAPTTA